MFLNKLHKCFRLIVLFAFSILSISVSNVIAATKKIPLIVITDLYHPYQDPGDNFELINAYCISQIDLKAVILDCYEPFRKKHANNLNKGLFEDSNGPREPGVICVEQLNYIFGKYVPHGVGPFEQMRHGKDKMHDLSDYQNSGLSLLKEILIRSKEPISIASFGSSRVLAVAFNRYPALMKRKIKMIHLLAGTGTNDSDYIEWNVALDTTAFVTLLRSGLPIAIYPCASGMDTKQNNLLNAFNLGENNTYYKINTLSFIDQLPSRLRQYSYYAFKRLNDVNYLNYLDKISPPDSSVLQLSHHVWETAVWMSITNLKLVKSAQKSVDIKSCELINKGDTVFEEGLLKCDIEASSSGTFQYKINSKGRFYIYQRGNPFVYQSLMNEAIPKFYASFEL